MTARVFYFNATTFAKAGLPVPLIMGRVVRGGPDLSRAPRRRLLPARRQLPRPAGALPHLGRAEDRRAARQRDGSPSERERDGHQRRWRRSMRGSCKEHVIAPAPERASYGNVAEQELRPWITGRYAGLYYWTSAVGKLVETLEPGQKVVLAPYFMRPGARDAGLFYQPGMMIAMNSTTGASARSRAAHRLHLQRSVRRRGVRPAARSASEPGRPSRCSRRRACRVRSVGTGNEQIARLPHRAGESGYFEHPRVRDAFFDILESQGFGEIDAAESGPSHVHGHQSRARTRHPSRRRHRDEPQLGARDAR